jgi:hypothetical protein
MLRWWYGSRRQLLRQFRSFHGGIEMLGHRFAAEPTSNRACGRTHDGAYRASSERTGRGTSSDAAYRCSKADSHWVRAWSTCDRIGVRPSLGCGFVVHAVLRCTVKHGELSDVQC